MTGGIQTQVGANFAPAVAGDFADANPRSTVLAGPGGLVCGAPGVFVGRFAWAVNPDDADGAPAIVQSFGVGVPAGFVHRDQQALITAYLDASSMLVRQGFGITLFTAGSFWVKNDGATNAVPPINGVVQKVYAKLSTGQVAFAATGSPPSSASATGTIAPATGSFTGSIADDVLTLTAIGSGVPVVGGILSGTNVATGTQIVSQLTGTVGSTGTYIVSIPGQTVASTTISETYGIFTAVSGLTGLFTVGSILSGAGGGGVTAGTTITSFGTGTGGLGTYNVQTTQTVTSTAIAGTTYVETKWIAASGGLPGQLVKITSHLQG